MGGMTSQKWEIDNFGYVWGVDSEGQKYIVAQTSCYKETGKDFLCSECMANMRLVSKAPEMLKMLKTLEWCNEGNEDRSKSYDLCPYCDEPKSGGVHLPYCELSNLIAQAEGTE